MIKMAQVKMGDQEIDAVARVMCSGMIAMSSEVAKFEKEFAEEIDVKHAVMVSSGTAALIAALSAIGDLANKWVVTTPFTFIATINAIIFHRAIPVFVDVDPYTYNMSPDALVSFVRMHSEQIRAILPVHLFGLPADMTGIIDIANEEKPGIPVIEDCAQAHNAEIKVGKEWIKAGAFGKAGAFSFYATKNMGIGEGGMVTTNDDQIAEKVRKFINFGRIDSQTFDTLGFNFKSTDIVAVIGRVQLGKLGYVTSQRIKHAAMYDEAFECLSWLRIPYQPEGYNHVYHLYTVRITTDDDNHDHAAMRRAGLMNHLKAKGIESAIYYPKLVYQQPMFNILLYNGCCHVAEMLTKQVLSLPVHQHLSDNDIKTIIDAVLSYEGSAGWV